MLVFIFRTQIMMMSNRYETQLFLIWIKLKPYWKILSKLNMIFHMNGLTEFSFFVNVRWLYCMFISLMYFTSEESRRWRERCTGDWGNVIRWKQVYVFRTFEWFRSRVSGYLFFWTSERSSTWGQQRLLQVSDSYRKSDGSSTENHTGDGPRVSHDHQIHFTQV